MSRALQICYSGFDHVFLKLPENARGRIEQAIDAMGRDLGSFPHYRMTGGNRYRLRVGDYRVVYTFDVARNEIHLLAVGHRSEIYR
jgi:mRNA interferase RelE/StbE